MSLSKFESEVKYVSLSQEEAYARLSDLNNLAVLKENFSRPEVREQIAAQVPADQMDKLQEYADALTFDTDTVYIASPMGQVTLRIVEREAPKCLKFASEGAPLQLYLWIQLLSHMDGGSRMKVTVGAEVNFVMKGMVSKPLQQAADMLANVLSVNA